MKKPATIPSANAAILTLAEIKATVEAFDRGEANVCITIEAIQIAVDAYRDATREATGRSRPRWKAA